MRTVTAMLCPVYPQQDSIRSVAKEPTIDLKKTQAVFILQPDVQVPARGVVETGYCLICACHGTMQKNSSCSVGAEAMTV